MLLVRKNLIESCNRTKVELESSNGFNVNESFIGCNRTKVELEYCYLLCNLYPLVVVIALK